MSHEVYAGMGGNGGNDNDAESDRRRCRGWVACVQVYEQRKQSCTWQAIADQLQVTRERVRQIYAQVLRKFELVIKLAKDPTTLDSPIGSLGLMSARTRNVLCHNKQPPLKSIRDLLDCMTVQNPNYYASPTSAASRCWKLRTCLLHMQYLFLEFMLLRV